MAAMAGGGINPTPGELSLSLHGVLFLDEMAEFSPRVLDLLRQPLEENSILISRAGLKIRFPTQFLLVGAMNPCRCGMLLDAPKRCTCSDFLRRQYMNRISGPLLDRIDLFSELYAVDKSALLETVHVYASNSKFTIRTLYTKFAALEKSKEIIASSVHKRQLYTIIATYENKRFLL